MKFDSEINCTPEKEIGYLLSRKKRKGCINIPEKAQTGSCCFVIAITTKKKKMYGNPTVTRPSVHLEKGGRVYFTVNNTKVRLCFSPKKKTYRLYFYFCTID
jgi:hypothetical protein